MKQRAMEVQKINSHQIQFQNSKYWFFQKTHLDILDPYCKALSESLREQGILEPLVVFENAPNEFHLIHGFLRMTFCIQNQVNEIPTVILPASTSPETVLDYVCVAFFKDLQNSVVVKAKMINLANQNGINRKKIIEKYLPLLGLEAHETVLKKLESILKLPPQILNYCHEKKFSLRQCIHLTRHPTELLKTVFFWHNHIHLSASLFEEILNHLKDCMRLEKKTPHELLASMELESLLTSSLDPHVKTETLRDRIRKRKYPILSKTNDQMHQTVQNLQLPSSVQLKWDPTLEIRALEVGIKVQSLQEWQEALSSLNKQQIPHSMEKLLNAL